VQVHAAQKVMTDIRSAEKFVTASLNEVDATATECMRLAEDSAKPATTFQVHTGGSARSASESLMPEQADGANTLQNMENSLSSGVTELPARLHGPGMTVQKNGSELQQADEQVGRQAVPTPDLAQTYTANTVDMVQTSSIASLTSQVAAQPQQHASMVPQQPFASTLGAIGDAAGQSREVSNGAGPQAPQRDDGSAAQEPAVLLSSNGHAAVSVAAFSIGTDAPGAHSSASLDPNSAFWDISRAAKSLLDSLSATSSCASEHVAADGDNVREVSMLSAVQAASGLDTVSTQLATDELPCDVGASALMPQAVAAAIVTDLIDLGSLPSPSGVSARCLDPEIDGAARHQANAADAVDTVSYDNGEHHAGQMRSGDKVSRQPDSSSEVVAAAPRRTSSTSITKPQPLQQSRSLTGSEQLEREQSAASHMFAELVDISTGRRSDLAPIPTPAALGSPAAHGPAPALAMPVAYHAGTTDQGMQELHTILQTRVLRMGKHDNGNPGVRLCPFESSDTDSEISAARTRSQLMFQVLAAAHVQDGISSLDLSWALQALEQRGFCLNQAEEGCVSPTLQAAHYVQCSDCGSPQTPPQYCAS
jgi:hypothetical protein